MTDWIGKYYLIEYIQACGWAAVLAVAATLGGVVWAGALFFFTTVFGRIGRVAVAAYVQIFRNTPVLLPIYLVYFGFPMIGIVWPAAVCGCFAITLQQGAYVSEIFRGSYKSIDRNLYDAAQSIGLSGWQIFSKITVPQVIVYSLPSLGSQVVLILKDTSLLSAITVAELMMQAKRTQEATGAIYWPFLMAAAMYLFLTLFIDYFFARAQKAVRWR